jgi:hypothetical protein
LVGDLDVPSAKGTLRIAMAGRESCRSALWEGFEETKGHALSSLRCAEMSSGVGRTSRVVGRKVVKGKKTVESRIKKEGEWM